jgi:hypothetical protein
VFCEPLAPDAQLIRRLQRRMERQRRAANPDHYDEKGRIRQAGKQKLVWKQSKGYQKTRRRKAEKERKLAAYRKSLHGRHPARSLATPGQTEPVLSWLRATRQKTAFAALASLRLWDRPGATRPLLGLPGFNP